MRPSKFEATLTAAEWLLRIEDGPLTEADKAEFLAWLRASPVHVREYLGVARAGRRLSIAFSKQLPSDLQEVLKRMRRDVRLPGPIELTEHKGRRKFNGRSRSG
jgi:transmembrane sensor